jgi:hypothetical protein
VIIQHQGYFAGGIQVIDEAGDGRFWGRRLHGCEDGFE